MVLLLLLTLGACASEGYSSWVFVCVCPGKISSHQPVMVPTIYILDKFYVKNVRISLKMHGSKVMTINTAHAWRS